MMQIKIQKIYIFVFIILLLLLLVSSLGTSPVYPHNFSYDSAFFRFIGKEILTNKIPYKDIWDHKGPILYYLQALGAICGTTNKGMNILFLMQVVSAFLSTHFMYKVFCLFENKNKSNIKFIFYLVCICAVFSITIESGNLSEEWCLPITCCNFYLFAAFAMDSKTDCKHPRKFAFLHGICIGLTSMIRANNALPVFAGILIIGIFLLVKKEYKNILENILFGLLGISCIYFPVFLWFYFHGALEDMVYAVFQFNIEYSKTRTFILFTGEPMITRYLPIFVSANIYILFLLKKRSFLFIDGITTAVLLTGIWMTISTNIYLHYFTTFLPVLFFIMIRCSRKFGKAEASLLICLLLWFGWKNIQRVPDLLSLHRQQQMFTAAEKIPYEERSSVIAINMPPEIYLNYDLEPVSRFCAYQHIHLNYSPEFKTEFIDTLQHNPPLWILAFCSGETNIPEVQKIIDSNYTYRFDQSDICYYHLRDK